MSMQSKFKFWAFLPVGLLLIVTGLLIVVTLTLFDKPGFPPFSIFVFYGLFLFVWTWLVFGELRTKIIKAQIHESEIIVFNYLGLGKKKVYCLAQFEGFETALLPSKYGTYEYLYLIQKGKKVIKLSQFYHSNYYDLKLALADRAQNLGQKHYSLLREVKEIFI